MPRTDRASRVVGTSCESVHAALVDAGALAAWLPPAGMAGALERFDPHPGGSYRMVLTYPAGSAPRGKSSPDTDVVEVRFIDVVPGARVVQAVDFVSEDPAYAGTMITTWELPPVAGGTRVDIRADNVPDAISAEDHAAGTVSSLAQLAAHLDG